MGNQMLQQSSQQSNNTKQQLYILYECEQGELIQSKTDLRQYFIRQLSFNNQKSFNTTVVELSRYKENQKNSKTLTNLLNIEEQRIKNMCGSLYRLSLIFEFSALSINDEIQARKQYNNYFDILDCYRIVIGCIKGVIQVEKQYKQYTELVNYQIMNRVFVHPERILLMPGGLIKLCSPLIVNPYDRLQHKHSCYYSPEKLADFDFNEDEKSVIFELGITLLHILTLKSCKDIYNGFEVKQDTISNKVLQIWRIYSDSLLCQILAKMTQTVRHHRTNINQCLYLVYLAQEKLREKEQQVEKQIFNLKPTQNKYYTEIEQQQQMGVTQRKIIDYYNANNFCINTYSRYRNNTDEQIDLNRNKSNKMNISTINNCQLQLYSEKNFENNYHNASKLNIHQLNQFKCQPEKDNYPINKENNIKQLGGSSNKQNYKHLSNISKKQIIIPNNQSKQSLMIFDNKKSMFGLKDANISSENYNNLEMINSRSFNYSGRSKVQQSFQYGNQLTEGIFPLYPQQQKQFLYNHQNNNHNDSKFQRKRTQFLKNVNKNNLYHYQHKSAVNLTTLNEQNCMETDIVVSKFMKISMKDSQGITKSQ